MLTSAFCVFFALSLNLTIVRIGLRHDVLLKRTKKAAHGSLEGNTIAAYINYIIPPRIFIYYHIIKKRASRKPLVSEMYTLYAGYWLALVKKELVGAADSTGRYLCKQPVR